MSFRGALTAAAFGMAAGSTASAEPALWTLSDADTTVHIMGTVHLLPPDTPWRTERIDAAFQDAHTVCFELDAVGRALEVAGQMFELGALPPGQRLSKLLPDEDVEELREIAEFLGAPFASLDVMQPWFASLILQEYFANHIGLEDGVEFTLHPEVLASGKTLCELETVDEQMTALARQPLDAQIASLIEDDADSEADDAEAVVAEIEAEFRDLVADWLEGDIEAIGEQASPDGFEHPAAYEAMLVVRNTAWIPRIEALLDEPGVIFVAVGAAHLAGPDSVIDMLRDRGHAIDGP